MIFELWQKLSPLPFGKFFFSLILGHRVPYTGSICPRVLEMRRGFVRIQMKDRRRLRNHLQSVHAIAIMNLAEVSSGLAVLSKLPKNLRAIITHLEMDYLKKARGKLEACAEFKDEIENLQENKDFEVRAVVKNEQDEEVARLLAKWTIGPTAKIKN